MNWNSLELEIFPVSHIRNRANKHETSKLSENSEYMSISYKDKIQNSRPVENWTFYQAIFRQPAQLSLNVVQICLRTLESTCRVLVAHILWFISTLKTQWLRGRFVEEEIWPRSSEKGQQSNIAVYVRFMLSVLCRGIQKQSDMK